VSTLGLDHIGVGVTDMEASQRFYADLGFTEVAFDYSGPLPGLEHVAGRDVRQARVVMLRSANATPLGSAAVKLVQVQDVPVPPLPAGIAWGERGVCEVCVHVRDQPALHRWLVEERGAPALMDPVETELPPLKAGLSYVADPDGGKVELIEWSPMLHGWPGESGPQGVNHVAVGVSDMERSCSFYRQLGFTGNLFDLDDYYEPMHPWFAGPPPRQHLRMLMGPHGGWIEPVQHEPPSPDMRGEWGHVGAMDFGLGVRDLDVAMRRMSDAGVEFLSPPQTIAVDDGSWRYAYFREPDGNYASLCEARF
jgi:catechol 2,3-dioxygenase-like lactoylglutathione lyase family enzyme